MFEKDIELQRNAFTCRFGETNCKKKVPMVTISEFEEVEVIAGSILEHFRNYSDSSGFTSEITYYSRLKISNFELVSQTKF